MLSEGRRWVNLPPRHDRTPFSDSRGMSASPQIREVTPLMQSRLFAIESVELRFANGEERTFERLVGQGEGAVMVVPFKTADELLLIREYAVGVERYELGFVKGRIDKGENAAQAARRELREEIGCDAQCFTHLATVALTPAYSNYRTHIFAATDLFESPLPGDEPEQLETLSWPVNDLSTLREKGDFSDARSVLATYLIAEHFG